MGTAIALWVLAGGIALGVLCCVLRPAVAAYLKFRGTRVITCPETRAAAAVEVDARHAAAAATLGTPGLRLTSCSRWPERQGCGQECLKQVEAAPADCLVRNILVKWYEGKSCALCGRPVGEIHWPEHRPALLSPEGRTVEWGEVPPENLPDVLTTHRPVCRNCHDAEAFRRQFPELVVVRPERGQEARAATQAPPPRG
jgi:hypothetical protein